MTSEGLTRPPDRPTSVSAPSSRPSAPPARVRAGGTPPSGGRASGQRPQSPPQPPRPGVREQLGRARGAFGGLISAHIGLLKAEIGVIAREAGIIAGLGLGLLALGLLLVTLLYTGTWLFLGEWLFGSLGWGVLHGALFTIALMVPIGLKLVGGTVRDWAIAFGIAVILTILVSLLFASNVVRSAAVAAATQLQSGMAVEPGILAILAGLVAGVVVVGVLMLLLGVRIGRPIPMLVLGLVLGAIIGAILGFVTFDTSGAIAVALTIGLITWIGLSGALAFRRGIDPKRRFGRLQPRESMKAAKDTRDWLGQEWKRQRSKLTTR